ncbi:MAG: TetR/AcrR family transcriptional regulator [Bacteroidota bacterium]|nr:TetR/AcrR family transcriptional regulator [Bacteroidota bacterium]
MTDETQNMSRKERERHFKRQQIVNAAREVFALRGFSTATLDEIADRAEYGKGTLYNYFQSKEELFDTVLADAVDEFVDVATRTCTDASRSFQEAYIDFARQVLHLLYENFSIYGLMMREFHKMEANTHLATLFPNLLLLLADPIRRAIARDEIDEVHPEQTAMMFLSLTFSVFKSSMHMFHGDVMTEPRRLTGLSGEEIDREIEQGVCQIERTFFHGILARRDEGHKCFTKR